MRQQWSGAVVVALLTLVVGCGGDGTPRPPTGPDDSEAALTARIDGVPFASVFATVGHSAGQVFINAGVGDPLRAIGFQFPDQGPDQFMMAPGNPVSAGVTIGNAPWVAGGDMGGGSISVTTSTANRIAGTFEFTVVAQGGQQPAELTVTEGGFDITY